MPIIVLDGPDVIGKSTLAAALLRRYPGARMLHLTYRRKQNIPLYHLAALRWGIRRQEPLAIIDRWWPSEYVYAAVYRGGSTFPYYWRLLDRVALKYGVCYCICHRFNRNIQMAAHMASSKIREEMYAPDDKIGELHDWYTRLYGSHEHRADWVSYNLDTEGGYVVEKARYLHATAVSLRCLQASYLLTDYVGSVTGDYLFIGDIPNNDARAVRWPWFAFNGASLTMAKALDDVGIGEDRCMWANVHSHLVADQDHQRQLFAFMRQYKGKIVALGRTADRFLRSIEHVTLPHPAYVKRFKGAEKMSKYLEQLK